MPGDKIKPGQYAIKKNKNGTFKVYNTITGKTHSKHATKSAAKHQKQLLYAVGHGWKPKKKRQDDEDDYTLLMYDDVLICITCKGEAWDCDCEVVQLWISSD